MPYDKSPMKKSSCIKMYDDKGKQTGLMMEGSVAHMESVSQEKKNLMKDMPVDDKASAMEMSPYKMDHGDSAAKFTGMSGGSAMHKEDPEKGKKMIAEKLKSIGAEKLKSIGAEIKKGGMDPGQSFHYAGGDKTIRESFDKAYAKAKQGGYDTFRFGHSGVEDPKTGKFKFKTQVYTTK